VAHGRFLISWTSLIAVTFTAAGQFLFADDQPASSEGYKTVPIRVGNKTIPVRVSETVDPYKNVSSSDSSGKYDPERIFSTTSSMANKTFVLPSDSLSKGSDFNNRDQNTFITKPYAVDVSSSVPNLDAKPGFRAAQGYDRSAAGFDKGYLTSASDLGPGRMAALGSSGASADQNRAAILGGSEKPEPMTLDSMADKAYLGSGAQNVPDNIVIKDNVVISRMSGLPNRPLSIDEVRNLINHGAKPDTDVKPEEPGKSLNDPDYKPEPLRDTPQPGSSDDDKDDAVPPPGTMAAPPAPENSEPLPQP